MNKPPASSTAEPATTPEADLLSRLKASLGEAESYEAAPVFAANLRAAIVALESATTPASTAERRALDKIANSCDIDTLDAAIACARTALATAPQAGPAAAPAPEGWQP
jgi:hypothetical protein